MMIFSLQLADDFNYFQLSWGTEGEEQSDLTYQRLRDKWALTPYLVVQPQFCKTAMTYSIAGKKEFLNKNMFDLNMEAKSW